MHILCILFLLLPVFANVTNMTLPPKDAFQLANTTNRMLSLKDVFELAYENENLNITFVSKVNRPFCVVVYNNHEGKSYQYKGTKINYVGVVSYIEIRNLVPYENVIDVSYGTIPQHRFYWMEKIRSYVSILTAITNLFYDGSRITKCLHLLLLVMELVNGSYDLVEFGNKITNNILKMKLFFG